MSRPSKNNEHEFQTKYIQLQLMRQQLKALSDEREMVLERMKELAFTINAIQKMDEITKGSEMWSTLGSSTFVKSDIKDTANVLVGIGAGIVVKETKAKALKLLDARLDEIKKIDQEFIMEMTRFAEAINTLEPQVEKLAHEQENK